MTVNLWICFYCFLGILFLSTSGMVVAQLPQVSQAEQTSPNSQLTGSSVACDKLRVSGSIGWNPLIMKNKESQKMEGVAYDLIKLIGDELNVPIDFIELPWKRSLKLLETGELDVILGLYWNQTRSEKYLYTSSFLTNEIRAFVLKESTFPFNQLNDLVGRAGDAPFGASFGDDFDNFAQDHLMLQRVQSNEQSIVRLFKKRSEFFISDYLDALWSIRNFGALHQIVALPKVIATNEVYFAVTRKSPCTSMAAEITNVIERFKNTETMDFIIQSYIQK